MSDRNDDLDSSSAINSDPDCGTLTSFKLDVSKGRAKYRRIEEGLLSDTEKEKLNQRRERNKAAAARCRNRRRETICRLEKEASDWEGKVQDLKKDIEKLTTQRDQLEFTLQVHNAICSLINDPLPSQRLDDLIPQSSDAPPRAASANHVMTPTSSALPPLSEVVKTESKLGLEIMTSRNCTFFPSQFQENTLKLLILGASDAAARNGDILVPTSIVATSSAVKPSTLNLNLNVSSASEIRCSNSINRSGNENVATSSSNVAGDSSSTKNTSKGFTLPLIVTPMTPQGDISNGNPDTPVLAPNFLLDGVSKFTPSTPLFSACVSSSSSNNFLGSNVSLNQQLKNYSTAWTPLFTTSTGLTPGALTFNNGIDTLFRSVIDVKPEPSSPPLSSTTETNSIVTTDSAD